MHVGVVKRKSHHRVGGDILRSSLFSVPKVGLILNFLCPSCAPRLIWFLLLQRLAFVDVAIGWYGPGLGAACGMAYTGKYFDNAR